MKTSALPIFGTSALLALGLCACGGPAGSQGASDAAPGAAPVGAAVAASPAATPSPTEAKKYTDEELAALLGQLRDTGGTPLSLMSRLEIDAGVKQSAAMLAAMTVEPAECNELVLSSPAPSLDGASAAVGISVNAVTGATASVSLASGLDPAALATGIAQIDQLDKCAIAEVSTGGTKVAVKTTRLSGLGSVQPMIAYRADTEAPDGRRQSMITGQLIHHGVLISVITSGGASEDEAVSRAGGLLDQAAALVGR